MRHAIKRTVYVEIGQGELAPKVAWIVFDMDNGDPGSHRYVWWFPTRREAREKVREHERNYPQYARLAGPLKYVLEDA